MQIAVFSPSYYCLYFIASFNLICVIVIDINFDNLSILTSLHLHVCSFIWFQYFLVTEQRWYQTDQQLLVNGGFLCTSWKPQWPSLAVGKQILCPPCALLSQSLVRSFRAVSPQQRAHHSKAEASCVTNTDLLCHKGAMEINKATDILKDIKNQYLK